VSSEPQEFELEGGPAGGGTRFRIERLKVKASLAGLKLVGRVLLPALAEAHAAPAGQVGAAVEKAVEGLDCLPELLDLFSARTKFQRPASGEMWIALGPALEDVFAGRPDLTVQFIVKCVQGEYGGFLEGNGPLAQMVAKAAAKAV